MGRDAGATPRICQQHGRHDCGHKEMRYTTNTNLLHDEVNFLFELSFLFLIRLFWDGEGLCFNTKVERKSLPAQR